MTLEEAKREIESWRALAGDLGAALMNIGYEDPGVHHGLCADVCFSEYVCWTRDEVEERCLVANAALTKLKEMSK